MNPYRPLSPSELFGELRSLLSRADSELRAQRIGSLLLAILDSQSELLDTWSPYIQAHRPDVLLRYPDDLRIFDHIDASVFAHVALHDIRWRRDRAPLQLKQIPNLDQVSRLVLHDHRLSLDGLSALERCGLFENLEHLDLSYFGVDQGAMEFFCSTRSLQSLTHLWLRGCGLYRCEYQQLLSSPLIPRLSHLDLSEFLDFEVARLILETPALSKLESLELHGGSFEGATLRALTESRHLDSLKTLGISLNNRDTRQRFCEGIYSRDGLSFHVNIVIGAKPDVERDCASLIERAGDINLSHIHMSTHEPEDLHRLLSTLPTTTSATLGLDCKISTPEDMRALARASILTMLTRLWLQVDHRDVDEDAWSGVPGDQIAQILSTSSTFDRLMRLDIDTKERHLSSAIKLARASWFERCETRLNRNTYWAHVLIPWLRTPTPALNISNQRLGPADIQQLAKSPSLRSLRSLDLSNNKIGDAGARALADCVFLDNLQELNLSNNAIRANGTHAITTSDKLDELRELNIDFSTVTAEILNRLGDAPYQVSTTHLWCEAPKFAIAKGVIEARNTTLTLECVEVDPSQIAQLIDFHKPDPLTTLILRNTALGEEGARCLARYSTLSEISTLVLDKCGLGSKGGRALASSPYIDNITHLELLDASETVRATLDAWSGSSIEHLYITHVPALGELIDTRGFEHLRTLGLFGYRKPHVRDLRSLSESARASQIEHLLLLRTRTNNAGLHHLTDSKNFTSLRRLTIQKKSITDEGIEMICGATWVGQIETLELRRCNLSAAGTRMLVANASKFESLRELHLSGAYLLGDPNLANAHVSISSETIDHIQQRFEATEPRPARKQRHTRLEKAWLHGASNEPVILTGDDDVLAFIEREHAAPTHITSLRCYEITHVAARALSQCTTLGSLTSLRMTPYAQEIADEDLEAAFRVKTLSVDGCGDAIVSAIANATNMQNLKRLDLMFCGITDAGARSLAMAKGFRQLRYLDISYNPIENIDHVILLERSANLRCLVRANVRYAMDF